MKNFGYIIIVFLLFSVGCGTVTKLILNTGGKLSTVENPNQFYDTTGKLKGEAVELCKKAKEFYHKREIAQDIRFREINSKYDSIRNDYNLIIDEIATKIKKGEEIKYKAYQDRFNVVSEGINELSLLVVNLEFGLINDASIDSLLIEVAKKILVDLAKKQALKIYANTFKKEYSMPPFDEIEIEIGED